MKWEGLAGVGYEVGGASRGWGMKWEGLAGVV